MSKFIYLFNNSYFLETCVYEKRVSEVVDEDLAYTCTDPESFFRGGPNLITFFL